jgi:hypothetical protein
MRRQDDFKQSGWLVCGGKAGLFESQLSKKENTKSHRSKVAYQGSWLVSNAPTRAKIREVLPGQSTLGGLFFLW